MARRKSANGSLKFGNEPNLKSFWTGGQDDYFKLYNCTAAAIKSVDQVAESRRTRHR